MNCLFIFLGILLFPFTRSDWSLQYNSDEPVQPKYDLNAPGMPFLFLLETFQLTTVNVLIPN